MIPVSVIIPARDEAAVIGRLLQALTDGAEPGELDVVVVCNGCRDDTASVARAVCPTATVVELARASKSDALNAGDWLAQRFPRFYVDADVELPITALRATAALLCEPGVLCANPRPRFLLEGRGWAIRRFYDTWQRLRYVMEGGGSGVYALSEEGHGRVSHFPDVIADDQFVRQQFTHDELRCVDDRFVTVHPPTRIRGLIAIRTRTYRGCSQLTRSGVAPYAAPRGGVRQVVREAMRHPRKLLGIAVYATINSIARIAAVLRPRAPWERDSSTRLTAIART